MRYCSPDNDAAMVDARNDYWMPMDQYIGGIEHAVLHLLYARFWTKVMRDVRGDFPGDPQRGLVKFDEPFTHLLCQGMVLNHIYHAQERQGRHRVLLARRCRERFDDETAASVGATLEGRRHCRRVRRRRHDVQEQEQRRRPAGADRPVRRRHRAAVRDVRVARPSRRSSGRVPASRARSRFLRRLWAFAYAQHAAPAARRRRIDAGRALAGAHKALRREIHAMLRQADYDYQRQQYNTVVSAAMKMLNALEGAKLAPSPRIDRACCASACRSCCGCCTRWCRTSPTRCGTISASPRRTATCSTRRGRRSTRPRWCRTRSNWCCRSTARCAARSGAGRRRHAPRSRRRRCATEAFARHAEGRAASKVIVVPGRLVNVVV